MGVVVDRLLELYRLRDRVNLAIRAEERRRALAPRVTADTPVKLSKNTRVHADTVRAWAREQGIPVGDRGRIREDVWAAYFRAHA